MYNDNKTKSKKLMCFGDCNIFGTNPYTQTRYIITQRWPKILERILNSSNIQTRFELIDESNEKRTLLMPHPSSPLKPALIEFSDIFNKWGVVQYIIICIGTNDLQKDLNLDTHMIASGLDKLVKLIRKIDKNIERDTEIIIVSPIRLGDNISNEKKFNFDKNATIKSYDLPLLYREVAKMNNCYFLDAGLIAKPSTVDNLHMESKEHEYLAYALANIIVAIEKNRS